MLDRPVGVVNWAQIEQVDLIFTGREGDNAAAAMRDLVANERDEQLAERVIGARSERARDRTGAELNARHTR